MSTKYPQGLITPTPPFKSTTAKSFSGVWTLEQLAKNFYYYTQAVPKSLRFRSSASAYLSRTPSTGGNQQTWTWSGWVKRGTLGVTNYIFCARTALGTSSGTIFTGLNFTSSDTLNFRNYIYGTGEDVTVTTSQVFRDPSAWYHIALALDTTQGSSSNRVRMYVNGVQVTAFSSATYPSQNEQLAINYPFAHQLARQTDSAGTGSDFYDGYWSEINFIDGQALDPSYFGQVSPITGVWSPAAYVGSYGTNGFYLKFSDTTSTTALCYDYSGNGNNWTPNNISLTSGSTYDSMLDSPTNYDNGGTGVGNYAVLNPLNNLYFGGTISGGNLNLNYPASPSDYAAAASSIAIQSGTKVYFELVSTTATYPLSCGIRKVGTNPATGEYLGFTANEYTILQSNGNKINNNVSSSYGVSFGANDVLGCAVDLVNGTIYWSKNGTWMNSGDPAAGTGYAFSGLSGDYYACVGTIAGGNTCTGSVNFGQRPFAYTPPTGYKALNTQNLPAASIVNGASYMAATLYTGTGATQSIVNAYNGVSFQPDFVWIKTRSTTYDHRVFDTVRPLNARLFPNSTSAEVTSTVTDNFISFNSNGFTLGAVTGPDNGSNQSGQTFVGWQWKANGTAVTNTTGNTTAQVSANPTSGFSVITWTEPASGVVTLGHGLNVAPSFYIVKYRTVGGINWGVYHASIGAGSYLWLNTTDAASASSSLWNNTAPTSSVITIGSYWTGGTGTVDMVAYCFAAIPGYSAFGSYTGNGSTDGPFVYCGFRPRYVLIKDSTNVTQWVVKDTARNPSNVATQTLFPNLSNAEESNNKLIDIVSNGFKVRVANDDINTSGATVIYAAFAENPFKYSLAR